MCWDPRPNCSPTPHVRILVPRYKHTRFPGRPQRPDKNQKSQLHGVRHLLPWGPLGEAVTGTRPEPGLDPGDAPAGPSLPFLSSTSAFAQRVLRPAPTRRPQLSARMGAHLRCGVGAVWWQKDPHAHVCVRAHVLSGEPARHSGSPGHTDVSSFRDQAGQAATGRARTPRLGEIGWPSQGHWDDRRRCWAHGATLNEPKRMGGGAPYILSFFTAPP